MVRARLRVRSRMAHTQGRLRGGHRRFGPRGPILDAGRSGVLTQGSSLRKSLLAAAVALAFSSSGIRAQQAIGSGVLPSGGRVVAGQAAISQAGAALTIQQNTARAAIDWQSFN